MDQSHEIFFREAGGPDTLGYQEKEERFDFIQVFLSEASQCAAYCGSWLFGLAGFLATTPSPFPDLVKGALVGLTVALATDASFRAINRMITTSRLGPERPLSTTSASPTVDTTPS